MAGGAGAPTGLPQGTARPPMGPIGMQGGGPLMDILARMGLQQGAQSAPPSPNMGPPPVGNFNPMALNPAFGSFMDRMRGGGIMPGGMG